MSDEKRQERRERAPEILPWADPYIAGLVEKLRAAEPTSPFLPPRWDRWQMAGEWARDFSPRGEQAPPLFAPHPEVELPRRMPQP